MRRKLATAALGVSALMLSATPALAHDCFNPQKNAHAPTAGVHYEVVGFTANGPILQQVAQGKGIGGFAAISSAVTGGPTLYVHTIGNSSSKEEVGGPGSQKPQHACDGKGIDYLDACFGG
jgi:hypothetical protein